jgi:hypothetical protein
LPSRSPAPAGAGQNSSACETSHRKDPHREQAISQTRSLRNLYPRLDRPRARAGFQLARRPI